jgi:hypothetical protein
MKKFSGVTVAAILIAATVGTTTTAQAQVRRFISFENTCNHQVRVYISHADGWRNWHPHGPFIVPPFSSPMRLEANGITLTQTEGHDLYFYAESLDGSGLLWDGSDHVATFAGVSYTMRRAPVAVNGGWLNVRLTC